MKKKHTYRSSPIKDVTVQRVLALLAGVTELVLAIDIAKEKMVFGVATALGKTLELVRFEHPRETPLFLALVDGLRAQGVALTAVLEPTGTYGHALRHQLHVRGIPIFMIDPKRSHDAALVFDGVPSMHDPKACTILAELHAKSLGKRWIPRSREEKRSRHLADRHRIASRAYTQLEGELEALLAAHWPELSRIVGTGVVWHLHLLNERGGPAGVLANPVAARELLRRVSHGSLRAERIEEIVGCAQDSLGIPLDEDDVHLLKLITGQMLALHGQMREVDAEAKKFVADAKSPPSLAKVARMLGAMTSCVLFGDVGDPCAYDSAAAFEKALGLNLKVRSSGETKGQLHITKRGPGRSRQYLYLAALRFIRENAVVRAWYEKRTAFAGGLKRKAVVAVMRKLSRALVHVARGADFDASKLFDTRRLENVSLTATPSPTSPSTPPTSLPTKGAPRGATPAITWSVSP
jgi:transposase